MMELQGCLGGGFDFTKLIFSWPLDHNYKVEKEQGPLDDLVNRNCVLYNDTQWKVLFSDDFRRSFGKLTCDRLKKLVLNLLLRLSTGWRPEKKSLGLSRENSSKSLQQFNIEGFYILCTIDIIKDIQYVQVIKVWDILPYEEIRKLTKRLENIYSAYTEDYIIRCTEKIFQGKLEVPRCWAASQEIIRFRHLVNDEGYNNEVSEDSSGGRNFVENLKVSESLLLMKFYSLSYEVVCHLLSGKEVDLPMQLTDEQMDALLCSKTSFIIGRSGTGKTTILTTKLFQNEQHVCNDIQGISEEENKKPTVLRQLFVTLSPQLCFAVKQHVSHLTSISNNVNSSVEISLDDVDVTSEFCDIPDTFIDIPGNIYPIVITFHKFLMMLDGTLGNSFFERFLEATKSSVALKTFIRSREVTFNRFCTLYWPHFNSNLTKKLDPSRVFTEIISHIKGGNEGKLSYEAYSLLAESRSSTLNKEKREIVYTLFETYEKMKTERGDFDLGDLVNDIHRRLKNGIYEGDQMDFVYVDEVQDLSMRQISLFKYICQNVEEGFTFAGDTAQTIARGIDFRFQDIRSLFYKEFLTGRISNKQEAGHVSEMKQLKQNFRTHAGVLDLAQSVIDMIYHYFIHSIDKLEPEISLISGEAPILLESGNDKNAIVTIFGGIGSGEDTEGFGAEQVILVRDDQAKTEVCDFVGKNALVLTILECKGLEFQDVLLYNFFGSSPLKDQWRVIYGYMKQHDWHDDKLPQSFPTFSEARHSILCSELKQLYVAVTRTRQRLWISENKKELSKPMFDYWKTRGLVQIRKLDDSVAQAMRVTSSPQEWRERGKKLFYENNFVMAKVCFERAGDTMWEKLAKASDLRASADQIRGTNREKYIDHLREAAGMFESVGKLESAALCYYDLGEYEKAGKLYLYKCGKTDAAAECFTLAGWYSDAAEAYAKGDKFSNCLLVCKKGKLFHEGLRFIGTWKKDVKVQRKELEQIEQDFLESGALDCYEQKDPESMMKFVKAFCSMESKRIFLRSLGCLDDLLMLEEESGNFVEAADLAKSWGDLPKEADLLEKAGDFQEAAMCLIWYVLFRAAWGNGNTGWPLKQFDQMKEICNKVKSLAKRVDSEEFYEIVCIELKVICGQNNSLAELKKDLHDSQEVGSLTGEVLSVRKILDHHFHLHLAQYEWEDKLPIDSKKNKVSVRTLVLNWNLWKKHMVDNFEKLGGPVNAFWLNYLGVNKYKVDGDMVYLLFDPDAYWVRNYTQTSFYGNLRKQFGLKGLQKDGKRVTIGKNEFAFALWSYWQSELLSVGMKVLETLEGLYKSKLNNCSAFHQSTSLLHIYEVSKFLFCFRFVNATDANRMKLERFLVISIDYFHFMYPLDWRDAVSHDLVSLKETDLSVNSLEELINQMVEITYIGSALMIILGSRVSEAVYEKLISKLNRYPQWKSFVEKFRDGGLKGVDVAPALEFALEDYLRASQKCYTSITPQSLVHLLDRLLLMRSFSSKTFYTTKSTFVGSFTHICAASTSSNEPSSFDIDFILGVVYQYVHDTEGTISWIRNLGINGSYYPLFILKLVMIASLICLGSPKHSFILLELLSGHNNCAYLLPKKFVRDLLKKRPNKKLNLDPEVVAEAFLSINDPLLVVRSGGNVSPKVNAPCAIFIDLEKSKSEIMSILFPRKNTHDIPTSSNTVTARIFREVSCLETDMELQMNWKVIEEISKAVNAKKGVTLNKLSTATMIKDELEMNRITLASALLNVKSSSDEDISVASNALSCLNVLCYAYETSRPDMKQSELMKEVKLSVKRLQGERPKIDAFMKKYIMSQESKVGQMVTEVKEKGDKDSPVEMVLENQSSGDNTQDARNNKGKGNNKANKSKKNKGKKK